MVEIAGLEINSGLQLRIAQALYEDWKSSDSEISDTWENAFPPLQRVFLRKAEVALIALST